jgi:hypothetical protein
VRLVKQLRDLNAHILGLVVNGAEAAGSGGYYGYSEPAGDGGGRAARGATTGQ